MLCNLVKAYSATLAMYRTALDALLFGFGYKGRMVGQKIIELEDDLKSGKGPKWARNLDTNYLRVIKDLGNSSLHISDDKLAEEKLGDDLLIEEVEITFEHILDEAYEREQRDKQRLSNLQTTSDRKAGKKSAKPEEN